MAEFHTLPVYKAAIELERQFRADKAIGKIIQPLTDGGKYMFADNLSKVTFKDVSL